MNKHEKTAIILGATGLTGNLLLQKLLKDTYFKKVILFTRTPIGFTHIKIEEHIINLIDLKNYRDLFKADVVFCCVGTTQRKTPNKEFYKAIDYGIPMAAAELSKLNGIKKFIVVSALGANIKSPVFYNRTKGEMEEGVLSFSIESTYILQPSLITGNRKEKRILEWMFIQIMKLMNYMLVGSLKKYRSISSEVLAECMFWLAKNPFRSGRLSSEEIQNIVTSIRKP